MKKLLSILTLVVLCSCGFEPLYQRNESPLGYVSISNEIFIDVIENREGQILRDLLRKNISRAEEGVKYSLKTNISIRTSDLGINIDDVATRKALWVYVNFDLIENGDIVFKGKSSNNVSYAINDNEFTTINAYNDEVEKSLSLIAEDIKLTISSFLMSKSE